MTLALYRNGSIYSTADPLASAMLVEDGTVAWVGGEHAANALYDDRMQLVDLQGALITPGFVDSHVHLTETGLALASLDLSRVDSRAELLAAVAAVPGEDLLLGFGWDETKWHGPDAEAGQWPTAAELDRAGRGREVYLARIDVHSAVISSALAERSGARQLTGWNGYGAVAGAAHQAVSALARRIPEARRAQYQRRALDSAAAAGIVAVAEMAIPDAETLTDLSLLMNRDDDEQAAPQVLPYWGQAVSSAAEGRELLATLAEAGVVPLGLGGDLNIDGSLGSRTALLREPYADQPGHTGSRYLTAEEVGDHLAACSELGVQGGFHVIGEAGMDTAVAGIRRAADTAGLAAIRRSGHRLEHAEMVDDAALAALVEHVIAVSVQPAFDAAWGGAGGLYEQRLGTERAGRMNRFASMLAAGVPMALGSDAPVTPLQPWAGVRACLEHHEPTQRISARAAFLGYSRAGWRIAGETNPLLGQLVPGAPASFAVWEVDELMVQVADERVQAWSTDPRARTPLLPALDTENEPRCLATVHHGVELFRSEGF
ncbi:amidohydrolase family protein [Acaricomes phytoseiuli]|uniref:amidohydrolase n=1 Tax=Acaricomes phytoseiuli TaxID=291968 RepID=UPI00038100C0|nr:amidohydrolase family protein [Acaricomes phytoseiuli]MCW1248771.1 amidohydrolase family protein [Acaricomes phytoseiuli]